MRKSDKRNKPQPDKLGLNKLGTLKMSKDELNEAKATLEIAKSIERPVFYAPKGFTYKNNN